MKILKFGKATVYQSDTDKPNLYYLINMPLFFVSICWYRKTGQHNLKFTHAVTKSWVWIRMFSIAILVLLSIKC